ncbi:MAG: PQQ-binding-like beta-propeller repeat protein [Phycisphaerales bacterium]|nr:PQQ-binding-like beta-propeller repeat protein [Phycisphaerales bacterium]
MMLCRARWAGLVGVLCCAGIAFADLNSSVWPAVGGGRGTTKAVSNATLGGPAGRIDWFVGAIGVGSNGGVVLSDNGYAFYRPNGAGNLNVIDRTTGALVHQIPVGGNFRAGPLVTTNRVFVPDGQTVKAYDLNAVGTPAFTTPLYQMDDPTRTENFRSIHLSSVLTGGAQTLYASVRQAESGNGPFHLSAFNADTGAHRWTVAVPGQSILVQFGPLWVGQDGKQRIAYMNNLPTTVHIIRDDGTSATVESSTSLAPATVGWNGQGALSADGTRMYFNTAQDGGAPALHAVRTDGSGLAWSLSRNDAAVNANIASPVVVNRNQGGVINRVYLACAGGIVVAVDDLGGSYQVAWQFNVGETGELTYMSGAHNTATGRTFIYPVSQGSSTMYGIEDLGSSAMIRSIRPIGAAEGFGGSASAIDETGAVYQLGNNGLFKFSAAGSVPPVASAANVPASVPGGFPVVLDGSASTDADGVIEAYRWNLGAAGIVTSPNAVITTTLPANTTINGSLTVIDNDGLISLPDPFTITVTDFLPVGLEFTQLTTPVVGHARNNSLRSDGTYLYYLNHGTGQLFRTTGGCNAPWEELATAPGTMLGEQHSGGMAYDPTNNVIITVRNIDASATPWVCGAGTVPDTQTVLVTYDLNTNTWTPRGGRSGMQTGWVIANGMLIGNRHAQDTNLGGPTCVIGVNNLDDYIVARTSAKDSLLGETAWWHSRVVQLAVGADGWVYSIKNDQSPALPRGTGDRLYRFDPANLVTANLNLWLGTIGGTPDNCTDGGPGAIWTNFETNKRLPAQDLGPLPYAPGEGSALAALPPNWKGLVGDEGGLFYIVGANDTGLEGFAGTSNRIYAVYDIADGWWKADQLPDFSTVGTAATFHDGEVYIKQGASSAESPTANPTNVLWSTEPPPPPIVVNAGNDQTINKPNCAPIDVQLTGSAAGNITAWSWRLAGVEISNQQSPTVALMHGVYDFTLVAIDDQCATGSDTVRITINGANPLPVEIAMDNQINFGFGGEWDAIFRPVPSQFSVNSGQAADGPFFVDEGIFAYTQVEIRSGFGSGQWFHAASVSLPNACFGQVDLSHPGARVRFTARYSQGEGGWAGPTENCEGASPPCPYYDAAIFATLVDANGLRRCIGLLYGPDLHNDPDKYPNWKTVEGLVESAANEAVTAFFSDSGFNPARVVRVNFHGTNWGGSTLDFVDLRDLEIFVGAVPPSGACEFPDNTCAELTAGACNLAGGVYQGDGTTCTVIPQICPGDSNGDGVVNFADISPFIAAIKAGSAGNWTCNIGGGFGPYLNSDANGDGTVNFADISPFIALLKAPPAPCVSTCP